MTSPKNRPLWVGTSWKMNKTLAEADRFVDELLTFPCPAAFSHFCCHRTPHWPASAIACPQTHPCCSARRTLTGQRRDPGPARSP